MNIGENKLNDCGGGGLLAKLMFILYSLLKGINICFYSKKYETIVVVCITCYNF